eukprot:scaffold177658_cov19-Prasinocladus_malaysianus.AAC.1
MQRQPMTCLSRAPPCCLRSFCALHIILSVSVNQSVATHIERGCRTKCRQHRDSSILDESQLCSFNEKHEFGAAMDA